MGYLQLKKQIKRHGILNKKCGTIGRQFLFSKLENPYLAVVILIASYKSQSIGIKLSFDIEDKATWQEGISESMADELFIMIHSVLEMVAENEDEGKWIQVTSRVTDQSFDWVVTCPDSLASDGLVHQLEEKLDQDKKLHKRIKVEKLPGKIILVF